MVHCLSVTSIHRCKSAQELNNGKLALCRSRVLNIMFHKNNIGSIMRASGSIFYSLLFWIQYHGLTDQNICTEQFKILAVQKSRELLRLWTNRLLTSWADLRWGSEARGGHLSAAGINVTFLHISVNLNLVYDLKEDWSKLHKFR